MKNLNFYYRHFLMNHYIKKFYTEKVAHSKTIQQDIEHTFQVRGCKAKLNSTNAKFKHLMKSYPSFVFIFFWRAKINKKRLQKLFNYPQYSCKIFRSTKIEGGLNCFHPFATVINAKSIGENFEFRNGLTIGNKNNDNELLPVIGKNVIVGANVCIIGKIKIGDNVVIGAGSVVVKDVPDNVVVAGNPAKVIKQITNHK